ncbi:uncharacterized protein LOC126419513 [Schistocerca serialis cubense]|uniref:uncharacterized protein LOC126419513 n=1 Tax=Schistocerca serialis cubense TaxID=2023355 RepID=UPI00214E94CC|nr:uncharacterized protein LOC126419513 [Schistocerca serialis cubense]
MLLTVCVLYNLWTLIVRQSFPELQQRAPAFWLSCDSISDAVFLLDVAVQFRTGYLEQGLMVYDSKKLAGHYLRSRAFLLDLSALLPLDLLQINLGTNPILRFPRFLKVYRVYDYYYMVESRTVYPNLWRVVNLIHILMILAHWFGCFYYLLSEAEEFQGDWVYPYRPGEYATLTRKYLGSLYWSTLTLTTIGDLPTPESNLDDGSPNGPKHLPRRGLKSRILQFKSNRGYIFTIVSYLIGVFIFATIVGQVGNVITNRNANRLEFERLLDGAKTYMRHHKVPGGMKRRVLRWYDYSWSRGRIQGGGDINTALGLLPDKLKTELALHVNLSVLKKVTIFQECQPEFLHDLVLKMKAYIFTPGDIICRKGEVAREMFIIADGILEVISETGRVLTTMKAGDFFGEIGILNLDGLNKRTADVRSVGYSELFSLSREDVLAAMKDYPEAQEILQNLGRKRLMEARNMNKPKTAAGHGSGHGRHGEHGGGEAGDDSAGKRIVDRLRSDVKGLKNALRKSRRGHRTNDESLELQPLNPDGGPAPSERHGSGKGVLRRMSRVRSDEADDIGRPAADNHPQGASLLPGAQPMSPSEKLGAGLPLLQRLRMLKEKQEREERKLLPASPPSPPPAPAPGERDRPATPEREHEVLGAGLPLLQRLKLLKQKEKKALLKTTGKRVSNSSKNLVSDNSVTSSGVSYTSDYGMNPSSLSPPTTADDSRLHSGPSSEEDSAAPRRVAAGSSILTRLASLKHAGRQPSAASSTASSDRHSDAEAVPCGPCSPTEALSPPPSATSSAPSRGGSLLLRDKLKTLVHAPAHTPPHTKRALSGHNAVALAAGELPRPGLVKKQPSWTILKRAAIVSSSGSREDESSDASAVSAPAALDRTAAEGGDAAAESDLVPGATPTDTPSSPARHKDVDDDQLPVPAVPGIAKENDAWRPSVEMASPPPARPAKPTLLQIQQRETKFYTSIDDLSPEYSGLPFVKKLKILNERQKLAELERTVAAAGFLRSSSLDSGGAPPGCLDGGLTRRRANRPRLRAGRSHSEATAMQYVRSQQLCRDGAPPEPPQHQLQTPTSPESNETPERRNLKSILKKLSAGSLFSAVPPPAVDMRKLMRAPTVEGYAARHSKLTKSVTFNRDTLQSPPASPPASPVASQQPQVQTGPTSPTTTAEDNRLITPPPPVIAQKKPQPPASVLAANQKNFLGTSLLLPSQNGDEEFFGDIISGIKQVIQGHLVSIKNTHY